MDWARHLQTRGQIEPTYVDQMERELERYRLHETTYSAIATSIPMLYASGLRGYQVSRHADLAGEYVQGPSFQSEISPIADVFFEFIQKAPMLRGVIISGAPAAVLKPYASQVGITDVRAVELDARSGLFTGSLTDNPAVANRKQSLITDISRTEQVVLAVGDSESDQPMLHEAIYRITFGDSLAQQWADDDRTLSL